jgi:hypothetical protein
MVVETCGFIAHVKVVAPECTSSHCIIHRQVLAVKKFPNALNTVLDEVVKSVNFIKKKRALNSRIFIASCDEMGSSCTTTGGRFDLCIHTALRKFI